MNSTTVVDDSFLETSLGQTGRVVGRIAISGGYGVPASAVEMAFERGCNYFYHGSFRKKGMNEAIKNLTSAGKREKLFIVAQVYTRWGWQFRRSFYAFLKKTGLDYVDALLLGWYNSPPSPKILGICAELKERGLIRHIAISGHERSAFPIFAEKGIADIFHIRYNAAHRGAELDVFPKLQSDRPGTVAYTATSWGQLLKSGKIPKGEMAPRASDCYRFVLSNPDFDVCMTGPADTAQMEEALATLDRGPMSEEELNWMRRVGESVNKKSFR